MASHHHGVPTVDSGSQRMEHSHSNTSPEDVNALPLARAIIWDLVLQSASFALLAFTLWHALPSNYIELTGLVLAVLNLIRIGVYLAIGSPLGDRRGYHRILLGLHSLTGLTWGLLPLLISFYSPSLALSTIPIYAIALLGLVIAVLASSALHVPTYFSATLPALLVPFIWTWTQNGNSTAMWILGFVGLTGLILGTLVQRLASNLALHRAMTRQNVNLLSRLAEARNQAERVSAEVERANAVLREEIMQRERMAAELQSSEHELGRILSDMQDVYFRVNAQGNLTRLSPSAQFVLGYDTKTLFGQPFASLFPTPGDHHDFLIALESKFGVLNNYEIRMKHAFGQTLWVSLNVHQHCAPGIGSADLEGTLRDITQSRLADEEIFHQKENLRITLESIGDAVLTTAQDGTVNYLNPIAEDVTGWTTEEAQGQLLSNVLRLTDESSGKAIRLPVKHWLKEGRRVSLADPALLINRQKNKQFSVELVGTPIRDSSGTIIGAVLVFRNVTKLRTLAKQLSYQASHDSLTNLANRSEFELRVEHAIKSARADNKTHTLCFIDLDQFKVVNDTCGHHAGDDLLKQLSVIFTKAVRSADMVARLGGDEFGLLMESCPLERALQVAETLRRTVEEFRFIWEGKAFRVGTSIGVVPITPDTQNLAELLSAADSACYVAKERGRNCVHVYRVDDENIAQHHGQMQWMQRIQHALEYDLFELHYQPIAAVKNRRTDVEHHAEVLLRMIDNSQKHLPGLILPNAFIPAAERYRLMPAIDRWVTRHALYALATPGSSLADMHMVSINLSGQSLADLKLLDYVLELLLETHVAPTMLCFEITESAVIANLEVARTFIQRLKDMGCRFALDDFGSGLSSFAYLKNLPVDFVKLDGALVRDVANDRISQAMVASINQVAHVMAMQTIAEYVESEAAIKVLEAIGVDYIQGYAIAHPQRLVIPQSLAVNAR